MRKLRNALLILALAVVVAGASPLPVTQTQTVDVQFINAGSGVNDGTAYVGPYTLRVDGVETPGTCVSWDLRVAPPWEWTADVYLATDFPALLAEDYMAAWWLDLQFAVHQDGATTVAIHHGIWDLFGADYSDGWQWAALARVNYQLVDPNTFRVLVPVREEYTQTFMVPVESGVPEPVTWMLVGIGLVLAGMARRGGRRT
jgi:hypothetical protein